MHPLVCAGAAFSNINKLTSVFHVLLFDHEFRHNIVKAAVDPRLLQLYDKHGGSPRETCCAVPSNNCVLCRKRVGN